MSGTAPPQGYTPGTSFAWNTRGQIISAATILPGLGIICVSLRFWARVHRKLGFGIDDWLILPALICIIGMSITLLVGVGIGAVAHTTPPNPNTGPDAALYQISPAQVSVLKIEWIFFFISIFAYGFIKLSVLFLYRRIFASRGSSTRFDIASKIAIGIVLAWTTAYVFAEIFRCGPTPEPLWGPLIELQKCGTAFVFDQSFFISDLITDVLVVGLPIPLILRLHMSTPKKIGVIGVLLLGILSVIASVVRIVYEAQLQAAGLSNNDDLDEALTTLFFWGMLEAGISLVATNLPSLHFLFTKKSLQEIIASIRSQLSLPSRGSSHASKAQHSPYDNVKGNESDDSHAPALAMEPISVGMTVAAGQDEYNKDHFSDPQQIHVKKDLSQHEQMV